MQESQASRGIPEKNMTQTEHAHVVELHTKAAYAHTAAAHVHSSGDHASAQELARKALKCSLEATRYAEKISNEPLLLAKV
jgi:hypothetical protein